MSSMDLEHFLKSNLRQTFQSLLCNFKNAWSPKQKLRIVRSWWKLSDPAAVIAKCMEAAWERFQTHSLGNLFLVPLESE